MPILRKIDKTMTRYTKMAVHLAVIYAILLSTIAVASTSRAQSQWTLADAATPYKGVEIKLPLLDRPADKTLVALIPEFEEITGIKVSYDTLPYQNMHEKEVADFTGKINIYDVALVNVAWLGEFASNNWIVPTGQFTNDPKLADPALNLTGFYPVLLDGLGTWNQKVYGLPFDNDASLMFYNSCLLQNAGFTDPPKTWTDLLTKYGRALTKNGLYAYALQSRWGETQSTDSFMRMVWAFGGSLLKEDFTLNLSSPESIAGLKYRQELKPYMPTGVIDWDHADVLKALTQGQVAIITEWTSNYPTLIDPTTSTITDCLKVAVAPAGPDGKPHSPLGGFSLAVNANSSADKQAAAWLFIQWLTSDTKAVAFLKVGALSGRMSAYTDTAGWQLRRQYPYFSPAIASWNTTGGVVIPPRFPEWSQISEILARMGTDIQLGNVSVDNGVKQIENQLKPILKDYTDGKKPKLQ